MRAAAGLLAVLLAAAIGFWAGDRHGAGRATAPGPRSQVTPPRADAIAPSRAGDAGVIAPAEARSPGFAPLPPLDTPVAQVLDGLERQARAGDMRAACRVAFELQRCHELRALQASMSAFRDLAERPGIGRELAKRYNAIADRDQARFLEGQRLCEGVASAQSQEAWRYLLQAARAGHGPSMARFASRRVFSDADPVAVLDGLIAFRSEGPAFLARAAQAGYPEAYEQLAFAYVTGIDLGLGVPHDAIRGVAYYTALMRVATTAENARLQRAIEYAVQNDKLDAQELARARAMAEPLVGPLLARNLPGSVELQSVASGTESAAYCER